MKLSIYLFTLEGLLLFSACADRDVHRADFPVKEFLSVSEVKYIDSVFMRYPFRIHLYNTNVYIMDLHATDDFCHVFDYPSMEYRRSFAKRGNGPGELLDAENIRVNREAACWVLDANKTRLSCFQADSEPDNPAKESFLDKNLIRTLDFDLYNDSLFIVPDYTGTHRFDILNPDGSIRESRGQIPLRKKDGDIPDMACAQAWRGFLSYNPENGLLAIATQLGEVIEIYDVPGDSLVCVIYGKQGEPQFSYRGGYAIPTGIMGYSDVFVGKENIYALFWGHTFEDINHDRIKVEGGNQIQVFDLKGNPVKLYISERYLTGFYIDEEAQTILGVDVNSDQPVVKMKI